MPQGGHLSPEPEAEGRLLIHHFGEVGDPLGTLLSSSLEPQPGGSLSGSQARQISYLRCYLGDLGASSILEEPRYIDRDYLAEFAAFYSTGTADYGNLCRRLHFFSGPVLERTLLERAISGNRAAAEELQRRYLGFAVVRPIPWAPLGRTVLRWYDERLPDTPRSTAPARQYHCHVAGVTLSVHGLAWQQQDSAVGACATVALWSLMQSSAMDEHHAIPTTADITRLAHKASSRQRLFPSTGLTPEQLCEAIKQRDLAPVVLAGDLSGKEGFGRERFASSCAALLRSGFPVLIVGNFPSGRQHAVCAVGFRESSFPQQMPGTVDFWDSNIPHLYMHDDNLGPNVRFEVLDGEDGKPVRLQASSPPRSHADRHDDPSPSYPALKPWLLIAAVRYGLRLSPDGLHSAAYRAADAFRLALLQGGAGSPALHFKVHFTKLSHYVDVELGRMLAGRPEVLASTRLALWERAPVMSFYVGVARIGCQANTLVDVLFDTTSIDRHASAFCHVMLHRRVPEIVRRLPASFKLGVPIHAF